jgi:type III secretion protein L
MKLALLDQKEIHFAKKEKIVPADALSKLIDAEAIIETAKKDAEILLQATEKKCETLQEQAQKKGFQEGLDQFNEHLLYFDARIKSLEMEMQRQILPLVLSAAKKIVAGELKTHPEIIVNIVLQAITPIAQNARFTIYVNKADKEILEKEKGQIKEMLEHLQVLKIVERDDIEAGGCIIETESGIINATLANQWHALKMAFQRFSMKK